MSLSVSNSAMQPITTQPTRAPTAEGQAFKALAKSLRVGDVDAAKTAYADVIRNAPEGATLERGSPFVEVGKALYQGDVAAAKAAFVDMVKAHRGSLPPVGTPTASPPLASPPLASPPFASPPLSMPAILVPAASTTGGIAGATLNEVA